MVKRPGVEKLAAIKQKAPLVMKTRGALTANCLCLSDTYSAFSGKATRLDSEST